MPRPTFERFALLLVAIAASGFGSVRADEIPDFMRDVVAPTTTPSPEAAAMHNILAIDDQMQIIYDAAQQTYRKNLLDSCPVILGLFSNQGGEFYLYRPGQPRLQAPRVPVGYEICKSTAHSAMAVYQLVVPYLGNPADPSWQTPMAQYLTLQEATLDGLDQIELADDAKSSSRTLLENNIDFMRMCLEKGSFDAHDIARFTAGQREPITGVLEHAARVQATHWMSVMAEWKALLGDDWGRAYGVSNSLYVARTNNILFTIMAQFFGRDAFNDRLLLIETTSFTTTPDEMIEGLGRIVSDRALGQLFFNSYHLMDAELVSNEVERPAPRSHGASRAVSSFLVIAEESKRLGIEPIIPSLAPFNSHAWPWRTDSSEGDGPKSMREALRDSHPEPGR